MSEDVVKKIAVTFGTGLPGGTRATFTHDGELWIAYPATKNRKILAVIDRMIGIYSRIEHDMVRWINNWPEDGVRAAEVMKHSARARSLLDDLKLEKREVQTS